MILDLQVIIVMLRNVSNKSLSTNKSMKKKQSFLENLKPTISEISKYIPGKSDESKEIIKLSSNESPFILSKNIIAKIVKQLINANRYPDGDCKILKKSIAKRFKLNEKNIICGNGSDDILSLIGTAFSRENCEIICSENGFLYYPIVAQSSGAKVILAEMENFEISLNNIRKKITKSTRIIFFANPNNPTGSILLKNKLLEFLKKIPDNIIVVIDGAYSEYINNKKFSDGTDLISKFPNVIITRTFSKIFALAGFRLGWGYASKKVIEILEKIRGPFNVNLVAQISAAKILEDKKFFKKSIEHNNKWINTMSASLSEMGLIVYPSHANFLFVKTKFQKITAKKISEELKKFKIYIRDLDSYGLKNHFRVSVGNETENKFFLKKIKDIINKNN